MNVTRTKAHDSTDNYQSAIKIAEGISRGEEWAMAELYERMTGGALRFKIAHAFYPRHDDFTEDVMHDAYLDVISQLRRIPLRDPARLMGFVHTIVKCKIAEQIDKQKKRRNRYVHDGLDTVDQNARASDNNTPLKEVLKNEMDAVADQSLSALNKHEREILERFYLNDQKPRQICREMKLSQNEYRLRKSRAKAKFGEVARERYEQVNLKAMKAAA